MVVGDTWQEQADREASPGGLTGGAVTHGAARDIPQEQMHSGSTMGQLERHVVSVGGGRRGGSQ